MSNKVLVIDNDESTISQVSDTLGAVGYDVLSAATADAGRKMASELTPALILINLATPGSNGLELCKTIHTTSGLEGVPIILLTLKEGKFNPVYVKLYGIVAFLKKPFPDSELNDLASQHAPVSAAAEEPMGGGMEDSFDAETDEEVDSGAYAIGESDESLSDLQASFAQPIDYPEEPADEGQPSLIVKDDDPTSFDSSTLEGLQDENELSGGFSTEEADNQWGGGGTEDSFGGGSMSESASGEEDSSWGAGQSEGGMDMQQEQDEWGSGESGEGLSAGGAEDAFGGGTEEDSFSAGSDEDAFSAGADDSFSAGGEEDAFGGGAEEDSFSTGAEDGESFGSDEGEFSAGGTDDSFDASEGVSDFSAADEGGDDFLGDDLAYEEPASAPAAGGRKKAEAEEELPPMDDDFELEGGDLSDLIQDDKGKKDKKMEKDKKKGFKKGGGGGSKGFIIAIIILLLAAGGGAAYFFLFMEEPKKAYTPPPPPPRVEAEASPAPPIDEPVPGAPAPAPMDQAAAPASPAPAPVPAPAAKPAPAPAPAAPAVTGEAVKGMYYVQFGAFSSKANAEKMLKRLKDSGVDAFISPKKVKGKTLNFVLSSSAMGKKADAEKEAKKIRKDKGFDTAVYKH